MSDEDAETLTEDERQEKQLRLVGYGIAGSGLIALLIAYISTRPHDILVYGLGGLALSTLVFERTQNAASGLSLGFLVGSFGVWLWPTLDGGSYTALGFMLVAVGISNAFLTPYFRRLGKRLAE
ncbi:MAG: hypothetical protein ACI8UR_002471 [Natronomonas sp.]|jgi:hypothetical protein|uniref:hypothetical protein n=1 Tax=Natronomonas sp. TaxID=2184060 RepID=UPI00398A1B77